MVLISSTAGIFVEELCSVVWWYGKMVGMAPWECHALTKAMSCPTQHRFLFLSNRLTACEKNAVNLACISLGYGFSDSATFHARRHFFSEGQAPNQQLLLIIAALSGCCADILVPFRSFLT